MTCEVYLACQTIMVGLFDEPDVPDGDAAGATAVGGPMILPSGNQIWLEIFCRCLKTLI